jgi:16S rRNA (adenine1518-N6/adenine1519-N6)-dimethyltransferase
MAKITARKCFGQNFLQDTHIINAIIHAINPLPDDFLVEIGPGRGALTLAMLKRITKLTAIEIDRDLVAYLEDKKLPGLNIISADALSVDYSTFTSTNNNRIKLYGNLPYNISTPLLIHLLHHINDIKDCHFMVQKEVAERIIAQPNSKDYGRLSVMLQYFFQTDILFFVSPEAFYPKPKVESAIIRLTPHAISPYSLVDFKQLESTVKQAFGQRRKTLRNNFKTIFNEENWKKLEIDPQQRPEQIPIEKFVSIAQFMLY